MPELPEVQTVLNGITPYCEGKIVRDVMIRTPKLRRLIDPQLAQKLRGKRLVHMTRRAKYLVLRFDDDAHLLIHLGMSGTLRILPTTSVAQKHEHIDWHFEDGTILRYRDPRRFGLVEYYAPHKPFLQNLGIEPLSDQWTGESFYQSIHHRHIAIKNALMNPQIVVGIGNIYANEALFRAEISPFISTDSLSKKDCRRLVDCVRAILWQAIDAGGSTLRDFVGSDGTKGYFQQQYQVYGRENLKCYSCNGIIKRKVQAQRSSFFCPNCQKESS